MTPRATWTIERLDGNLDLLDREPVSRGTARVILGQRSGPVEAPMRGLGYAAYYIGSGGSKEAESQWLVCSVSRQASATHHSTPGIHPDED